MQRHRYRFIFKDLEHESNVGEVSAGLLLIYRGFKHTSSFLGYQKESYAQTEIWTCIYDFQVSSLTTGLWEHKKKQYSVGPQIELAHYLNLKHM